jgi:hypothetical protein
MNFLSQKKAQELLMLSHQTALAQELKQKIKDEDLTKNATQCSINQQIFPLIPERFLSELSKPPLSPRTCTKLRFRRPKW